MDTSETAEHRPTHVESVVSVIRNAVNKLEQLDGDCTLESNVFLKNITAAASTSVFYQAIRNKLQDAELELENKKMELEVANKKVHDLTVELQQSQQEMTSKRLSGQSCLQCERQRDLHIIQEQRLLDVEVKAKALVNLLNTMSSSPIIKQIQDSVIDLLSSIYHTPRGKKWWVGSGTQNQCKTDKKTARDILVSSQGTFALQELLKEHNILSSVSVEQNTEGEDIVVEVIVDSDVIVTSDSSLESE